MTALTLLYLLLTAYQPEGAPERRPPVDHAKPTFKMDGQWYYAREPKRLCSPSEPIRHERPLAEQVRLSLSTDQQSYFVGEPIRVAMILRNEGNAPVRGSFTLELMCGFARIYHRRVPEPFRELLRLDRRFGDGVGRSARTLKHGEEVIEHPTFAVDPVAGGFVLDQPGEYQLKVVYRDVADDPNGLLTSDVQTVRAEAPEQSEKEALAAYSRGELAPLAQYDPSDSPEIPTAIRNSARELLDQYPDSVYADHLRRGLFRMLLRLANDNRATPDERELFEKLRAGGVDDR